MKISDMDKPKTKEPVTSWKEVVKPLQGIFYAGSFMDDRFVVQVSPDTARAVISTLDVMAETIENRTRYNLFVDCFADMVVFWCNHFAVGVICFLAGYYACKAFG